MRIAVTGAGGDVGLHVIRELLNHGHSIIAIDQKNNPRLHELSPGMPFIYADVTDLGQVTSSFIGTDAIIHLAALTIPYLYPPEKLFNLNIMGTWNVLQAAEMLGIEKIVLASSVNALGALFNQELVAPHYLPLDETHPTRAEDSYSLSRWCGEQLADGFARRRRVQIASLRLSWVTDAAVMAGLAASNGIDANIERRAKDFWAYLPAGDCARAFRLALEKNWQGHEVIWLSAADTLLSIPTDQAVNEFYPSSEPRKSLSGFAALIDCAKAKSLLGWSPTRSWRDLRTD